jgi:signal transduction histidine kinase
MEMLADRAAVSLALHNLLDNAVKYSGGRGPVRVEWARKANRIALSVRDDGPGIAPDERRRIFQRFVRGAAASAANVRGTGLGLAVVQLIAEAHGGDVVVDSAPGAGATFTLLLPAAQDGAALSHA